LQIELSKQLSNALIDWIKMGEAATLEKFEAQSVIIKS